ncbi:hypothetical protein LQK89_02575 [Curtobacterium sp. C1]|uniref:hypothetical protein n=1 Tax=Curtobacterium sp. C1 TaxID=2898151 RepID=UPI001E2A201E|nr:hypothetical protein [Curtobacterium sp. C1]UFU14603.1 hypothetical protein LQK89_02575 [Curtobacterium sp. C1]
MISTDGAALIATLIPIGLLVFAFEKRSPVVIKSMSRARLEVLRIVLSMVIVASSLLAIWFCVEAVAQESALRDAKAVYVTSSTALFFLVIAAEVGGQAVDRYFEALRAHRD